MYEIVKKAIITNKLIQEGDEILVALSGGADSVALLHLLLELKKELHFTLKAAHFNHCIRGKAADSDEQFCVKLCKKWEVEIFTAREDVPQFAKENGYTLETAARILRYDFLNSLSSQKIAVAHHKNDQAETVLAHLIRGSGLKGLCGMRYISGKIIRPLLDITKNQIESYVEKNSLAFCTDDTNFLNDSTRNKLRLDVIPYIENEFNPAFVNTLTNMAKSIQADEEFLESHAQAAYEKCKTKKGYSKTKLLRLENPIFIRVLMLAFENFGIFADIEYKHLYAIKDMLASTGNLSLDLPNVRVFTSYDDLIFETPNESFTPQEFDFEFIVGKEYAFSDYALCSKIVDNNDYLAFCDSICLDYAKIPDTLRIRTRKAGDIFYPLGAGGKKNLKVFLIDKKIEKDKRDMTLLCFKNEVLAIFDRNGEKQFISEKLKVDENTKQMLVFIRRKYD
ncbi:MAG: tRNA lysidine(34) synthetase TilS [Clostridiales bacterium]|nr:tRNA lysidine(34) synthetase TilS [Clostridiales bacterium]